MKPSPDRSLCILGACISLAMVSLIIGHTVEAQPAQPQVSDTFPLTFERDDFPFAAPTVGQPTVFQTNGNTRNRFVIVYRNGLLQRACGVPTGPCDYTASGNVTITYPANIIQARDLVTLFFYR
jgi:hypothetical protein